MKSVNIRISLAFLLSISITACSVNKDKSKPTSASKSSATTELNTNTSTTTSDSNNDNILIESPSENSNNSIDIALKAYKAVLQNKCEFYNTNAKKNQNLNDFFANNGVYDTAFKTPHFTVIDMDGDKIPEVIMELAIGDNNDVEFFEVLHYKDGKVYGYIFSGRALGGLKSDGTFAYSSSAADNGYGKLRFQNGTSVTDSIGYQESKNNKEEHFIDNKQVTSDKYETFQEEQDAKKEVTWYEFSQNSIDKELTNTKVNFNDDLCTDNEELLYSFKEENSLKILSVCVSKADPDYIVYRFGTKDNIELEYPGDKNGSWQKFSYSYYLRSGGQGNEGEDSNYLRFENGGYSYKICEEYYTKSDTKSAEVIITNINTSKETVIKGSPNNIKGTMIKLRDNKKIKIDNSLK